MTMKKINLLVLSVLMVFTLLLVGCGKKNTKPQEPPIQQPGTTAPGDQNEETTSQDALMKVGEMLGKSDEEVKDLFGGGSENKTEDGTILLGRAYATTLDGKAVTIESGYTEELTVSSVSVSFADQTMEEVKAMLIDAFGEPTVTDETKEMDSKSLTWTKDQISISMNESYGMSIIEFTAVNG